MGDVLNGRFSIVESILDNRLYKAVDTATGNFTAIKKWKSGEDAYNNELSALMSLSHPAVPKFIDCFRDGENSYIAEEWLEGRPVSEISAFPVITDFALACADFLVYIASCDNGRRIHGDIKPSNIMIQQGNVRFIDFEGSVKTASETRSQKKACSSKANEAATAKSTLRLASEYFTAPEVFYGKACPQSDIYSLGMVLAWMLGGVDENGLSLESISDTCALKPVIRKCVAVNLKQRYPDAEMLMRDIKKLAQIPESIRAARDICKTPGSRSIKVTLFADCNVCFGWELAFAAAAFFGIKTCIMALTERTQRKLYYYADSDHAYGEMYAADEAQPYMFDTGSIYKRGTEAWYSRGLICRSDENSKLYYSGSRLQGELGTENPECVRDLISWCKINFDCAIFVTDRYDDKSTVRNLSRYCNYTLATPIADIDDIEACKSYYEDLGGNVLYAAWEFNDKSSLPEEGISLIVGKDKYLGAVSHNDERSMKRNHAGKIRPIFHSETGDYDENPQYIDIINKLLHIVCCDKERMCGIV